MSPWLTESLVTPKVVPATDDPTIASSPQLSLQSPLRPRCPLSYPPPHRLPRLVRTARPTRTPKARRRHRHCCRPPHLPLPFQKTPLPPLSLYQIVRAKRCGPTCRGVVLSAKHRVSTAVRRPRAGMACEVCTTLLCFRTTFQGRSNANMRATAVFSYRR